MLRPVFLFRYPIKFPAKSVKNLFEEFTTVDMFHVAHASDKTINISLAIGGKFVGGAITIAAHAFARYNKVWIDNGANERNAFVGRLFILFLGVEGEFEFGAKILFDHLHVAQKLLTFFHWH